MKLKVMIYILILLLSLPACSVSSYDDSYEDGYKSGLFDGYEEGYNEGYNIGYDIGHDEGYDNGYEEGMRSGAIESLDDVASEVIYKYEEMEGETSKECGLHPEEAIIVLNDYLNGALVSEDEIRTAIESISYFYYNAWEVVLGIEEMDIDYEFD